MQYIYKTFSNRKNFEDRAEMHSNMSGRIFLFSLYESLQDFIFSVF